MFSEMRRPGRARPLDHRAVTCRPSVRRCRRSAGGRNDRYAPDVPTARRLFNTCDVARSNMCTTSPASKARIMTVSATVTPRSKLLPTPRDQASGMIDLRSQRALAAHSVDAVTLRDNAAFLACAVARCGGSTCLTTVAMTSFSGPLPATTTLAQPATRTATAVNGGQETRLIRRIDGSGEARIGAVRMAVRPGIAAGHHRTGARRPRTPIQLPTGSMVVALASARALPSDPEGREP